MKASTLDLDTNPYGFYMFSRDYFKAAKIVSTLNFKGRIKFPAYFLYCRSLELIIKSILLVSKKNKVEDLKEKFGHDLTKGLSLLKNQKNNLIKLSPQDEGIINDLNKWYKIDQKKFEYYSFMPVIVNDKKNPYPNLPPLKTLENLLNKFLNSRIKKYITEA